MSQGQSAKDEMPKPEVTVVGEPERTAPAVMLADNDVRYQCSSNDVLLVCAISYDTLGRAVLGESYQDVEEPTVGQEGTLMAGRQFVRDMVRHCTTPAVMLLMLEPQMDLNGQQSLADVERLGMGLGEHTQLMYQNLELGARRAIVSGHAPSAAVVRALALHHHERLWALFSEPLATAALSRPEFRAELSGLYHTLPATIRAIITPLGMTHHMGRIPGSERDELCLMDGLWPYDDEAYTMYAANLVPVYPKLLYRLPNEKTLPLATMDMPPDVVGLPRRDNEPPYDPDCTPVQNTWLRRMAEIWPVGWHIVVDELWGKFGNVCIAGHTAACIAYPLLDITARWRPTVYVVSDRYHDLRAVATDINWILDGMYTDGKDPHGYLDQVGRVSQGSCIEFSILDEPIMLLELTGTKRLSQILCSLSLSHEQVALVKPANGWVKTCTAVHCALAEQGISMVCKPEVMLMDMVRASRSGVSMRTNHPFVTTALVCKGVDPWSERKMHVSILVDRRGQQRSSNDNQRHTVVGSHDWSDYSRFPDPLPGEMHGGYMLHRDEHSPDLVLLTYPRSHGMIATEHGRPGHHVWHRFQMTRYAGLRQLDNATPAYWGVTGVTRCSYLWFMGVTYPVVDNSPESRLSGHRLFEPLALPAPVVLCEGLVNIHSPLSTAVTVAKVEMRMPPPPMSALILH